MNRDRALAIATHVGMPWRRATPADSIGQTWRMDGYVATYPMSWNGAELLVTDRRKGIDILHETCHWLVASKSERKMPEFGLGDAPYADVRTSNDLNTIGDTDEMDKREILTCILELQILFECGGNWRQRGSYLNFHTPSRSDFWSWIVTEDDYPHRRKLFRREYAMSLAEVAASLTRRRA